MKTFYVTFGLSSVCGKNYLICYAPDENTLRVRLNEDMKRGILPKWAGVYVNVSTVKENCLLAPLASAYIAPSVYTSRPCPIKEGEDNA